MTNEKGMLPDIFKLMMFINGIIIVYYCILCPITIFRICSSFEAYDFISEVGKVPGNPYELPLRAITVFSVLVFVSISKWFFSTDSMSVQIIVCFLEMVLCVVLIASLNFYYSGVALLVLADLVHYSKNNTLRSISMGVLVVVYTIGRYEILPDNFKDVPFDAYLSYYRPGVRGYLSGLQSVLVTVNLLLFVYFMVKLFTGARAENKRILSLYDKLKFANERLRKYTVELEHMTEIRERNRLAREIHDTLGHTLTGVIMVSEAAIALVDVNPKAAKERMQMAAKSARDGLGDVRQSINALRPDALEKHSLETALEKMVADFYMTTSASINFVQNAGKLEFAEDEEDVIYRVVQESMTNALRHGHATEIDIYMERNDDMLIIDIRDNGVGCEDVKEGFGLYHMQERLDLIGGSLTYGNRVDDPDDGSRGFFIITSIKVREKKEDKEA